MKYILKLILLFIAIVPIISSGCNENKSFLNENLTYEMIKYQKTSAGCDSLRNDNCAEIKIEFPQISFPENKVVEEKINKSITEYFSKDIIGGMESLDFKTLMDGFIKDYESFKKEFPDSPQSWSIERTGEVKLNKCNIFSVDYTEYAYTGGAHANTFVSFKNFNLTNGEDITLDELIPVDKQEELTKIGERDFRKLKKLKQDEDLGKAGYWFENDEFSLNDNFLITDSSLIFYYNNYDITAYAFGPTELNIPYTEIKPLIGENSLLTDLIK